MSAKQSIYTIAGIGAFGALAFFAWKKWGAKIVSQNSNDSAPMASQTVTHNAPAAYTPSMQTYTPLPIGINTGANSSAPPGVPSSQVTIEHPGAGNAHVTDAHSGPSASQLSNPAHDHLVSSTGQAAIPTNAISSAPALTGNAAIVDNEYVKIFGRHAEQAGLAYWKNAMDKGIVTAADLDRELIRGAQGSDINKAVTKNPGLYISAYAPM